jgi:hypothetical protein
VFYVGKGTNGRKDSSDGRTSAWKRVAKKGYTVEVYKDNLSDSDATSPIHTANYYYPVPIEYLYILSKIFEMRQRDGNEARER